MDTELVEIWRGDIRESVHRGHAVVCDGQGAVIEAWGDPETVIYPRSSAKPMQALPVVESGLPLTDEQIALACASHDGAAIHTERVGRWLADLGLGESDLRCGPQDPDDRPEHEALIRAGRAPCQLHNNCSGKHAGFLMLGQRLGAGPDYVAIDHPVQAAVKQVFEEVTGIDSPGWGIDGCSAPNHATTLAAFGRAGAAFAAATGSDRRGAAMVRIRTAMMAHPDLVAGEGRACTRLMRALAGKAVVKTGAEGVFLAILPERRLAVALKISDGATRASEAALAAILVRLGVADRRDPVIAGYVDAPILSRRGARVGVMRPAAALR